MIFRNIRQFLKVIHCVECKIEVIGIKYFIQLSRFPDCNFYSLFIYIFFMEMFSKN